VGNLSNGQMWSSYGGDDSKKGRIISGPLTLAPLDVWWFPVAHGPSTDRLSVARFDIASGKQIGVIFVNRARPRWQFYEIRY
jgi:hypothetical protein